ncbi:MAG: Na/Pi cotransporter family protein [Bacteroidaceae bacterium]|nr:Na/Pi cotransporter family protein [Bacteroidaceae bacterium]
MTFFDVVMVLGCLALLMFGMKTMSEGLQKFAGGTLRKALGAMTTNRFAGVATGAAVTAAIQSSTATTLMTVSFVNAGLLTLIQAISVIMGANIGTTFTAWIMAVFGFSVDLSKVSWILFACSIPFFFSKSGTRKSFGEFLFGFAFMFLGLMTLRTHAQDMNLQDNIAVVNFFRVTGDWGFLSILLYVVIGGLLTLCVQSSAAIMAITMILCSTGVLPIYQGIALVMGENIGTTLTSNIAAMSANTSARRAALAHLTFNTFGVIWVLCVFKPFVRLICSLWGVDSDATDMTPDMNLKLTYILATFHTAFNVMNTGILIGFIKRIEKFVCRMIPNRDDEEDFRLKYIPQGLMSTSEMSLYEARKETAHFGERAVRMYGFIDDLLKLKEGEEFIRLFTRTEKYENISDNMEVEIAGYLTKVSEGRLSPEGKLNVQCIMREASELESICDSVYNLARTLNRKQKHNEDFTQEQYEHIGHMMELVRKDLNLMIEFLTRSSKDLDISVIVNQEHEINNYRSMLRDQNIRDINDRKYAYQTGVYYMDLINELEKIGDYVVNVVEARMGGQKIVTD